MHERTSKHFYGNSARLFVNLELGCASGCTYCYLPTEGFEINAIPDPALRLSASHAIALLERDDRINRGRKGTLLSLGCFSECWDNRTRSETIQLIKGLLSFGNPIQVATKREVEAKDLAAIVNSADWNGQLSIYISTATVSEWAQFERGTTAPSRRFESFAACRQCGVRALLYIKPVLPGVTINDASFYGSLMEKYRVDAIVGDLFEEGADGPQSPISQRLVVVHHPDVNRLRAQLGKFGNVYSSSIELLKVEGGL